MSPVLSAMGVNPYIGYGAVRFSLGKWSNREELGEAAALFRNQVSFLRG